ncbi:hypothetical protein [Streptomyces spectabilis]|uniref:Uncharacterized protein n=1 Tax=Streptomyces spectabilis TaxID=68270 RepID=A0A5P2XDE6_STRST|nr:hypothetical protein [Streptomyces spectabilis]MBB5109482.1 hypothetical protein [Streptomyces spectabilis]MCI3904647.1 hypothetical protein [Streptomyces spectabilis]QEV61724.1 hypothetical protein CP982_25930 [Streptomyces spectabilis]GGV54636.1 hypothetical protein GCM10010245_86440 [Streptomyces spectabilis]
MRPCHAIGAALGALALIVTIPTSANATVGFFHYQYGDSANPTAGKLEEPEARACINIPEVEGKPGSAFSPSNDVGDSEAMLYSEEGCEGTTTKIVQGQEFGADVKFKSVIFEIV